MIAFENMKRVDSEKFEHVSIAEWNWKPAISDIADLDSKFIEASGGNTTSKDTFSSQQDHGENH